MDLLRQFELEVPSIRMLVYRIWRKMIFEPNTSAIIMSWSQLVYQLRVSEKPPEPSVLDTIRNACRGIGSSRSSPFVSLANATTD